MRLHPLSCLPLVFSALVALPLGAQEKHPLSVEDYLALKTVGDPQITPDGARVAYTVTTVSLEDNRGTSRIMIQNVATGESKEVPSGTGSDRAPRWSPDGRVLAFISSREGGAQIWRFVPDSGTLTRLTSVATGVSDIIWSPTGKEIAFTTDVKWPDRQEIDLRNATWPTDAKIWTSLFYRHWNEWRVGTRQHVFRVVLATGYRGGPHADRP